MQLLQMRSLSSKLIVAALLLFAVYSNIRLIIRNYHLRTAVESQQKETERLETRNQKLDLLLSYYGSASYQEVEARRRLGLKLPDETAYVVKGVTLPKTSPDDVESTVYRAEPEAAPVETPNNLGAWYQYFFSKE